MSIVNIDTADIVWEDAWIDSERPRSRLLATLQFSGVYHHLEAIEVQWDDRTATQSAVCSLCEEILSHYNEAAGGDGPLSTVTIGGRAYALFVTPYCR